MFCNRMKAEGSRSACVILVLSWVFEDDEKTRQILKSSILESSARMDGETVRTLLTPSQAITL